MRTLTTQETQVHSLRNRAVHMRVKIDSDGAGTFQDMTSLDGYDWVISARFGDSIDMQVATASVQLIREQYNLSLAPLRSTSKYNASSVMVQIGREIRIETATVPQDTPVDSTDWRLVFQGYIDSISFGGSESVITLECRDVAARVADAFIENQTIYSGPMEDVIQDILDDWVNDSAGDPFTLVTPVSPSFVVNEYLQESMSAQEAIQRLADLIGWTIKFKYYSGSSNFQPYLIDPGRSKSAIGQITVTGNPSAGQKITINGTDVTANTHFTIASTFNGNAASAFNQTAANLANAINASAQAANLLATFQSATYAQGTITFSAQPTAAGTVTIGATTFTARDSLSTYSGRLGGTEFVIGPTLVETVTNFCEVINNHATANTKFRAIQRGTDILIESKVIGVAGNSETFTESMANCTIDGAGTLGGTQTATSAKIHVQWRARGTAGNAIAWSENLSNATIDAATLGTYQAGTNISSVYTFDQDDYYDVDELDISRLQIRNVVRIIFSDTAYLGNRTTVEVFDQDSIDKYGRRFMSIAEASTSPIDTPLEALQMANNILDDLKEPEADQTISIDYFYATELSDYYTFTANNIHYDADQNFAVIRFEHNLERDKATTSLSVRGTPAAGNKRWLGIEGRTGVAAGSDLEAPEEQTVKVIPGLGGLVITYDAPAERDWATTEVYLSTASIAATVYPERPDPTLLVASGRQSTFYIGGLTKDVDYYGRIIVIDAYGNFTSSTSFITKAIEASALIHENDSHTKSNLIKNGELNVFTKGDAYPPDGWAVNDAVSGGWSSSGTDRVYFDETTLTSGDRAIVMVSNGSDTVILNQDIFTPIAGNDIYVLSVVCNFDVSAPATFTATIGTFEADLTPVGSDGVTFDSDENTWVEYKSQAFIVDASVSYFSANLAFDAGSSGDTVYIDRISLSRATPNISRYDTSSVAIATATTYRLAFDSANSDDIGYVYDTTAGVESVTIYWPGLYQFSCGVHLGDSGTGILPYQAVLQIYHTPISTGTPVVIGQALGIASIIAGGVDPRGMVTAIAPWVEMAVGDIVYVELTKGGGGATNEIDRTELIGKAIQRTSL